MTLSVKYIILFNKIEQMYSNKVATEKMYKVFLSGEIM